MDDAALKAFLSECRTSGIAYRDRFKDDWEEVEKQIRCVPPDSWSQKEDWQTKIFIPLQAKKSEIAKSYLSKMIFGKKRNFDIMGVEQEDKDDAQNITNLIDVLFQSGGFDDQKDYVLQEGVDIGTGFTKMVLKEDGTGIDYIWRSAYNVVFDPECGHDLDKARFVIDLYRRDLSYVIAKAKKDKFGYDKEVVQMFLNDAANEANASKSSPTPNQQETNKEPLMTVKSIDGTQDMTIPAKYKMVDVDEYWVEVPNEKNVYEKKRIVMLNAKYILSNDDNVFGFNPFQWCRTKPRKYDSYGRGYIENTRGLQELMNSCVNLGFDSLKISSMDIIIIDDNKVKDSTTIKYKPLAVWKMKDVNAVKISRQPVSAISDILRGLTLIDQIDQDASGVGRQIQTGPTLSGTGGSETNTLGEYERKLQMIDQRFLDVGRFIENDYFIPLIVKTFKFIVNPKLFDQDKVDRLIGMKTVPDIRIENGEAKEYGTKKVPKLDITKLRDKGEMAYDFKAVGVTQFIGRLEVLQKLKEALQAALSNPTLTALTKIDLLWKKLWQASDIDDYEEMIRTPQEAKELLGLPGGQPQGLPSPMGSSPQMNVPQMAGRM